MKKILLIFGVLLSALTITGCSFGNNTAKGAVEKFLDQYNNLSASVLTDLEEVITNDDFNDKQKDEYRDILKKQYSDLKYEIVEETYDGDTAVVTTKITVYDFYKVQNEASDYLTNNMDEFMNDNDAYDNSLFLDYKLKQMKNATDTVEYTIDFNVVKNEDGDWAVEQITTEDLEKIHGIYNYEVQ